MSKGHKRHRSLFELMDPKGVYRSPALAEPAGQEADQAETEDERPVAEEAEERVPVEAEPVADKDTRKPLAEAEVDSELSSEPILSANDGKVRLVTNYPLAGMLCFAAVVLLICAVLVGWRLGYDSALRKVSEAQNESRQETPDTNTGESSEYWTQ